MEENIVQTLTVPYDSTSPNKERKFVVRARNNLGVGHWSDPIVVRLSKAEKSLTSSIGPPGRGTCATFIVAMMILLMKYL